MARGFWTLAQRDPCRASVRRVSLAASSGVIPVLVGVAVIAAACGGSPNAASPTTHAAATTTTIPVTTSTLPSTPDTAVLAAYRAAWAAYEPALKTADPASTGLAATMVNPILEQVKKNLVSYEVGGIIGMGTTTLHPKIASLAATKAVVVDCQYSTSLLVYKKTGKQVPPITKPENDGVRATLVLDGSTWKVADQTITEGKCPAGY